MWVFGYGSLVWKVDFPYVRKVIGYIKGYERKFYQASIDHRGVPEKPGRVVTLIQSTDPATKVWGAAYKISDQNLDTVVKQLDLREVMGYEKVPIEFFPMMNHPLNVDASFNLENLQMTSSSTQLNKPLLGASFTVTMYYGASENEHYIGPASTDVMAKQIFESVGPSGSNKDYLFKLAESMRQISDEAIDDHLATLEAAVREMENLINRVSPGTSIGL